MEAKGKAQGKAQGLQHQTLPGGRVEKASGLEVQEEF